MHFKIKKKIFFIFSHQDDELAIIEIINHYSNKKNCELFFFYLTTGCIKGDVLMEKIRKKETLECLRKFFIRRKNIFFIGSDLNITDSDLINNLEKVYFFLFNYIKKFGIPHKIYTHCLEGGHVDHDSCNIILKKIVSDFKIQNKLFFFSFYNGLKKRWPFFNLFNPIKAMGKLKILHCKNNNFLKFAKCLFVFKSQKQIWIGIYPFLIFRFIIKKKLIIQCNNLSLRSSKPHAGKLMYEQRGMTSWDYFQKKSLLFFKKNIITNPHRHNLSTGKIFLK